MRQRSFLKWAGGKYGILDRINNTLPSASVLVEPFVGSGTVFLNTDYDKYILADTNEPLIDTFNMLKEHGEEFIASCRKYFTPKYNTGPEYYKLRSRFNKTKDKYLKSVLFVYLNRHCFNGLCRFNRRGNFNVGFGKYKAPHFPETEMYAFWKKSDKAEFKCQSFQDTMKEVTTVDAVMYCDPPYFPASSTANFTSYSGLSFRYPQHLELYTLAVDTEVPVLISNSHTTNTLDLYKECTLDIFEVRRQISCKADKREKVKEVLAFFN